MYIKQIFGKRLADLRNQAGEKRGDLAELLCVSVEQVRLMEAGKRTTSFEKLVLICQHYQVSADYLLGLKETP